MRAEPYQIDVHVRAPTWVILSGYVGFCRAIRGFGLFGERSQGFLQGLNSGLRVSLKAIDVEPPTPPAPPLHTRRHPRRSHSYSKKQYETQRLVSIFHAAGLSRTLAQEEKKTKWQDEVRGRGRHNFSCSCVLPPPRMC